MKYMDEKLQEVQNTQIVSKSRAAVTPTAQQEAERRTVGTCRQAARKTTALKAAMNILQDERQSDEVQKQLASHIEKQEKVSTTAPSVLN